MKVAMTFDAKLFAFLKPSENNNTSAMSSLSGTDIATGLNNCFRLSGNFDLPPYPFPAGFIVTKIPASLFTSIFLFSSSTVGSWFLIAHWMTWICWEIAESCSSKSLLNSSKHPQAPHFTSPMKILPIDLKSMPSSQLNTRTCLPKAYPRAFTDSVFPVPAGP